MTQARHNLLEYRESSLLTSIVASISIVILVTHYWLNHSYGSFHPHVSTSPYKHGTAWELQIHELRKGGMICL
jgi:hypothetical protein